MNDEGAMIMMIFGTASQQVAMQMNKNSVRDFTKLAEKNRVEKMQPKKTQDKKSILPRSTTADAMDELKEKMKARQALRKIARGEALTASERKKLAELNPVEKKKAELANEERKHLKHRVKYAKTTKEARKYIAQTKMNAQVIFDKGDVSLGMYMIDSANKVEEEYNNKTYKKRRTPYVEQVAEAKYVVTTITKSKTLKWVDVKK